MNELSGDAASLDDHYALPVYARRGIDIVRGEGALLYDADGREYIDCTAAIGVANLGHCHPDVVKAIQEQAATLISCPNTFYNHTRSRLLEQLVQLAPASLSRAFLCNSGAEAIEAALKLARLHTGRPGFVTAMRGFHGRTMGAVSATFTKKYREPFEPLVPGFEYVPLNKIERLEAAVTGDTAAVLLELVQGEGGVNLVTRDYIHAARELCDARGALLIVDEIQTGFCRTGRFFACEHFDLQPDMMTLAKAMAGGVPMGATLVSDPIEAGVGQHGSTFGGNPLACAAALATMETMRSTDLAGQAAALGEHFERRLRERNLDGVREIRRLGLMIGVELKGKVQPVLEELMARGVLALPAGTTVLRLLPPLVISQTQIDRAADAIHESLDAVS